LESLLDRIDSEKKRDWVAAGSAAVCAVVIVALAIIAATLWS
jgi:hypothetical protein